MISNLLKSFISLSKLKIRRGVSLFFILVLQDVSRLAKHNTHGLGIKIIRVDFSQIKKYYNINSNLVKYSILICSS